MVYVAGDGTIHQSPPWSLNRLTKLFYGAIYFVIFFFKSLVGLDGPSTSIGTSRSSGSLFRGSGGGGGGGGDGGGGGGGPFRPGGGGPSKRIMTMKDINPPSVSMGGCPGGACGR
ncbi:glycine-rich selenoprotein [Tribolium castaneum]|uniref:Uncharacterized protein n=1 Tax=Tribolium castaneum TaxID=7070 RepID=A0A139WKV7_TRICA|nr:PREDICTED: glycine-rich selenoprotein-like [Tribolium castaneum]KYB28629.1 hypothetical protein TcasGA2_TC032376 [Tribolium castaneum]|eukprot:XP_976352.1 PREDICTED: glycine-rich selenoprotein-like [Tribolium castaneum]